MVCDKAEAPIPPTLPSPARGEGEGTGSEFALSKNSPYNPRMRIDIISDTICPWCFVGKKRLEAALAKQPHLKPEIVWHPFQLNPDMPREGKDRKQHNKERFGAETLPPNMLDGIKAAAKSVDLEMQFGAQSRVPNTLNSHRVVHWAGQISPEVQDLVMTSLFRRYFQEGADVGDVEVLATAAADGGMDAADVKRRLATDEDEDLIKAADEYVRSLGISGVPTFIVDSKYALQGAQEPDTFLQLFARIAAEEAAGPREAEEARPGA